MTEILAFLKSVPELIRIFRLFQRQIRAAETDRKVKDDLKTLHEAFETKDRAKLNKLFNTVRGD